jgi:hypothetical protein
VWLPPKKNTCREPITPAELASLGAQLQEIQAPKAAERISNEQRLAECSD